MIKLTLYLIIGILLGSFLNLETLTILVFLICSLVLFGLLKHLLRNRYELQSLLGLIIFINVVTAGLLTESMHDQRHFPNHYLQYQNNDQKVSQNISIEIKEILKPGIYHDKYIANIFKINTNRSTGLILLNIDKDSLKEALNVDDSFVIRSTLNEINQPLNPHQFDYGAYMGNKYIYRQIFTTNTSLFKLDKRNSTILGIAASLRTSIQNRLKPYTFNPNEFSIINALLLGQRQDISKEIYTSYSQAGVIHILAVSGLHVGIILLLLQRVLKPIERLPSGKFIKTILIILFLWCFAIIAGLSASIVRAVTMFTVFAIAMNLKRPTNVYNTLAISMFVLLLFKPNFLYDLGFQLSYIAVLAIVSIEPLLSSIWLPKFKIVNFFWRILTVTVSAQIGVIPISLYYFHQFPGLFFISNLVIIPCLGAILGLGIVIIVLAMVHLLPSWLASFYGLVIATMNAFVNWVSEQESFIFQNISFSLGQVIFCYVLIILLLMIIHQRSFKLMVVIFIIIISFQIFQFHLKYKSSYDAFIVFHKSRYSIFGLKHNKTITIHHNLKPQHINHEKLLINYEVGEAIKRKESNQINDIYILNDVKVLIIDSLGVYNVHQFNPDFIVLRNSPKINLNRLIDNLKPQLIICDGSNFLSYQERWARTCAAKKIPFHQTSKKGALIYRY